MRGGKRTRKKRCGGFNKSKGKYVTLVAGLNYLTDDNGIMVDNGDRLCFRKEGEYVGTLEEMRKAGKPGTDEIYDYKGKKLGTVDELRNSFKRCDPPSKDNLTPGGKKSRKSRRKRKMKGGSLVGTDLLTGINTTDTNSALAFGTTGGTNYMLDTITAKEVSTGDYMNPDLKPVPMV